MSNRSDNKSEMSNAYAKEYYDSFLKKLPTDYKSHRWSRTQATAFDFKSTKDVLEYVLKDVKAQNILEIGPGDGVWTDLVLPKAHRLTLLDQSVEMLDRAKERLKEYTNIKYVRSDFLEYQTQETYDLVFAIRCFEYFEDKETAVAKLASLLKPGGTLVMVTKNPEHIRMQKVQKQNLHKGQMNKAEIIALLRENGFKINSVLAATWRFKANILPFRLVFTSLHWLHVQTNGRFMLPFLTKSLTESYLYVATKDKKIIVELYGLPGVGKSYAADQLAAEHKYYVVPFSFKRHQYLTLTFQYPETVIAWVILILQCALNSGSYKHITLDIALLFSSLQKIDDARKSNENRVVVDEGLVQRFLSYSYSRYEKKVIQKLIKKSPTGTVFVSVNHRAPNTDRYTDEHPRVREGEEYLENWKFFQKENLQKINEVIEEKYLFFNTSDTSIQGIVNTIST